MKTIILICSLIIMFCSFTNPIHVQLMWGPILTQDDSNSAVCSKKMLSLACQDPIQVYIDNQEKKAINGHIQVIDSFGKEHNFDFQNGQLPEIFKAFVKQYNGQGAVIYLEQLATDSGDVIPNFTIKLRSL